MRAFVLVFWVAVIPGLVPLARASEEPGASAAAAMQAAFGQVRDGDWRSADVAALAAGEVGRDIVEWYRLRAGEGAFADYLAFFERRPDWPDRARLRAAAETVIRPDTAPETVLDFFGGRLPATGTGVLRLIEAHEALHHSGDAEALAVLAWRAMPLGASVERMLLEKFGDLLKPHHEARLDEMLWDGEREAVRRMVGRVSEGWLRLAEARLALAARAPGVDARIEAVPEELRDHPGLAYERFNWRARGGRRDDAIALLRERSDSPEALGRPERWANWRRIYARMLMREGDPVEAYMLASRHFLIDGASFADLEWLSGYLALRYLDDPELALFHFDRFETAVQTPISLGRAGYWRGRAYAALGEEEAAQAAYAEGARHQTSFYGLLAAEAAGLPLDPALAGAPEIAEGARAALRENSVYRAAMLFLAGGEPWRAEQFLGHLAPRLEPPLAEALARDLTDRGEVHIALRMAKAAAREGVILPEAYFPLTPAIEGDLPVERALALAVARRESEFDPVVVSPAGARGMMQLMPGTAQEVSRRIGRPYSRDGLTSDPAYNVALGTTYLAGLIDRFGPAPVLVAVGYNAGPGRAIDWRAQFGDPRSEEVDVVDWIEHIPFRETRNYVMRVTEAVMVYRARIEGSAGENGGGAGATGGDGSERGATDGGGPGPVRMLDYLRNG